MLFLGSFLTPTQISFVFPLGWREGKRRRSPFSRRFSTEEASAEERRALLSSCFYKDSRTQNLKEINANDKFNRQRPQSKQ